MKSIPVFYTPKLVANFHDFSPSAGKPSLVLESWESLAIPLSVVEPEPLTREEISTAHPPIFVEKILACQKSNCFENRLPAVAESLPYTTGAFVVVAREYITSMLGGFGE